MPDQDALDPQFAGRLRELPTEAFRLSLLEELMQAATSTMNASSSHLRPGFRAVTPYLIIPRAGALIDFLKAAFGADEILRVSLPDGTLMHAEVRIGDSPVELGDAGDKFPAMPSALHLYVPDADATYAQAMAAGATSLFEPGDRPYGDREAGIRDLSGNNWYISTHKLRPGHHIPEGLGTVTPYLHLSKASEFLNFLQNGLGAESIESHAGPDGRVMHAKARIADAVVEFSDASPEWPAMPASLHLYVPDADATYQRAIQAGAQEIYPPTDQPYGERSGGVLDVFGNKWWIATYTGAQQQP